jgi:Helix-turn-helix domain
MHLPGVGLPERALLSVMAAHADPDGSHVYASYETYARILGCKRRYVMKLLARLEAANVISKGKTHRWPSGDHTRIWNINFDRSRVFDSRV